MSSRLIVNLLAAATLLAGCGSDEAERASATTDASALLRETFANTAEMRSAMVDLRLRSGGEAVQVRGPFVAGEEGRAPTFAFSATRGNSTAGATWTGERGYVTLDGVAYQVSPLVTGQLVAGYEQAFKNRGGLLAGLDFSKWLSNPRNDGVSRVGGEETVELSGRADAQRVLADLETLQGRAGMVGVPGLGGASQRLTPKQRSAAAGAIGTLDVTLYTGAADRVLRRLVVTGDVDHGPAVLDVTFTRVGEDQTIAAPAHARPFSELLKVTGAGALLGG
jgi:hypothetical protein